MKPPPRDKLGVQKVKAKAGSYRPWSLARMRRGLGFQQAKRKGAREVGVAAAPSMGQVGRMHKNALDRLPARYVTAAAILLFGSTCMFVGATLAGALLWWFGAVGAPREAKTLHLTRPGAGVRGLPAPEPAEMEKLVATLLAARTPAELEPLIRGSHLRPDQIVERLAALEQEDGKIRKIRYLRPIDSRSLRLESVLVTFDGGANRLAYLSPDQDQQWRVDFDGFARHVHPSWDDLLSGAANEGTVRVQVIRDNYYNGLYQDERSWVCFALPSPDHETLVFGYARRGSPQHAAMVSTLARSERHWQGGIQRMTLGLRHAGSGDRRQFEIARVLSDEWAVGGQPLDEMLADPAAE